MQEPVDCQSCAESLRHSLEFNSSSVSLSGHFPPPSDPARVAVLQKEVDQLLEKGAIHHVPFPSPGFYSRLFTVPKKTGGFRPVLDLSALNLFIQRIHFKMETIADVRLAVRQGDWATSIDLGDAFFHILITEGQRQFLRFV